MSANRTVGVSVLVDGSQAQETFTGLKGNVADVGTAAQSSSGAASQAFNDMGAAAQGAATGTMSLGAQLAVNKERLAGMNAEIANTVAVLAGTREKLAAATEEFGANSVEVQRLTATSAELSAQLEAEVGAKEELSVATQELIAQQNALAATSDLTTRNEVALAAGASRVTGTVIPGARAIGVLAGSLSMANLPMIALAIGGGLLIAELIKLAKASGDVVKVNADYVTTTALIAAGMNTLTLVGTGTTQMYSQQGMQARLLTQAGIVTALGNAAAAQGKLNESTKDTTAAMAEMNHGVQYVNTEAMLMAKIFGYDAHDNIEKGTKAMQENTKALDEALAPLNALKAGFGLTNDELMKFIPQGTFTKEQLDNIRTALDNEIPALERYVKGLEDATGKTFDLGVASLELRQKLQEIPMPNFDHMAQALQGTTRDAAELKNSLATAAKALADTGKEAMDFAAQLRVGKPAADAWIKDARELAASHHRIITSVAGLVAAYGQDLDPAQVKIIEGVKTMDDDFKKMTSTSKAAENAARSYALAIDELGQKIAKAEAALAGKQNFDAQRAAIEQEIKLDEQKFMIQHRLLQLSSDDLARFNTLRLLELTKVNNEELAAFQAHADKMAELDAKANSTQFEQDMAHMQAEAKAYYEGEVNKGVAVGLAQERSNEYLTRLQDDYIQKQAEAMRKGYNEIAATVEASDKKVEAIQADYDNKQLQAATKLATALGAINKEAHTSLRLFNPQDVQTANMLVQALSMLNPALTNFGKSEESNAAFAKDIDDAWKKLTSSLGTGGTNIKRAEMSLIQLANAQIKVAQAAGQDTTALEKTRSALIQAVTTAHQGTQATAGLASSLQQLETALQKSAGEAVTWGTVMTDEFKAAQSGISAAISAMMSGTESAMKAMGAALLEATGKLLEQIGTQLIARGIQSILDGIAINADPFWAGAGTALIAAGTAQVAEGTVLGGVGAAVSGIGSGMSSSKSSTTPTTTTSGTLASISGGSTAGSGNRAPIQIPITTTGGSANQNPVYYFMLSPDAATLSDVLDGKGYLKGTSLGNSRQLKNLIKQTIKGQG